MTSALGGARCLALQESGLVAWLKIGRWTLVFPRLSRELASVLIEALTGADSLKERHSCVKLIG